MMSCVERSPLHANSLLQELGLLSSDLNTLKGVPLCFHLYSINQCFLSSYLFYFFSENPNHYLLMNTIIFHFKNFLSAHNKIFILKLHTKIKIAGSCDLSPKYPMHFLIFTD